LLRVENIHVSYGQVRALRGVSLEVNKGEIVALIGNNGAGKSTMQKAIIGLVSPREGSIYFEDEDIAGLPTNKIVAKGLCLVPEGRKIFATLTVRENLEMGFYLQKDKQKFSQNAEYVFSLFPILKERYKQQGGTLSGGQQQMLAIGRALMSSPKMMLMDEPSLGLSPMNVEIVAEAIVNIRKQGLPVLLVEQNAMMSLSICNHAYVLETGIVAVYGTGKELLENEDVQKAYLGI